MPVWLKAPSQWAPSQGAPRPPPSTGLGSPIRDLDTKFNTKRRPANRRAALGSDWYREVQPPKAPVPFRLPSSTPAAGAAGPPVLDGGAEEAGLSGVPQNRYRLLWPFPSQGASAPGQGPNPAQEGGPVQEMVKILHPFCIRLQRKRCFFFAPPPTPEAGGRGKKAESSNLQALGCFSP